MKNNLEIYIDVESIVNKTYFEGIKDLVLCVICTGVITDPVQCISCENNFCKKCIIKWKKSSDCCPFKCKNSVIKECSRTIKNLLDKIIIKCPYDCSNKTEFIYENLIHHFYSCDTLKIPCPTCGHSILKQNISENSENMELKSVINELEEKNFNLQNSLNELEIKLKKLTEINNSSNLSNENKLSSIPCNPVSKNLPFNIKEKLVENELGLIDKCIHFKGNYKPIFQCCNKAFPCFICHNEKQDHIHEFSNKVVCIKCNNIYSDNKCNKCNAIQMYKKKEK